MSKRSLDARAAEIRETRARLGTLLARADREYGLRAGLHGMLRMVGKAAGEAEASPPPLRALALPAALLAFALGILGGRRVGRDAAKPPPGDHGDKV